VTSGSALIRVQRPGRRSDGFEREPVEGPVILSLSKGVRPLPSIAAALVVLAALPAAAAPRGPAPTAVLVVADVGENARRSMPAEVWRKLAADYVGRSASAEDGTALPDDARCRSANAQYAVLATFDRATRLPGLAQDTDRAYGIARFTVRNCLTGAVSATKTVRIESEPLTPSDRQEDEITAAHTWERAVRATLSHEPLLLPRELPTPAPASPARVVRVDDDLAVLKISGGLSMSQLLYDIADASGKPHGPFELVVVELAGQYVVVHIIGNHSVRVGDYVEPAKESTPSAAPPR
jgi:hypothetical protein